MKFDPMRVPENVRHLVPLAERWSVPEDGERADLLKAGSDAQLRELVDAVTTSVDDLDRWLCGDEALSPEPSDEYVAFSCLSMAADLADVLLAKRSRPVRPTPPMPPTAEMRERLIPGPDGTRRTAAEWAEIARKKPARRPASLWTERAVTLIRDSRDVSGVLRWRVEHVHPRPKCHLRLRACGVDVAAHGSDLFVGLKEIRRQLEETGHQIAVQGARLNTQPSGMLLSMTLGQQAYLLTVGASVKMEDIVDIFDPADVETLASVDEQERFYRGWLIDLSR
ncbi:hypothetical protein AB0B66_24405 [Catellatospora sp. NPDC049111]|uniref:hypothetical protein n=1 Tax=Catellatospora sp. NPDC049111 TaxID=3155271 RepID=UPI00340CF099